MDERTVSSELKRYFHSRGLDSIGKFDVFNHLDDSDERTFIIDFAVGPKATKGRRTSDQEHIDLTRFQEAGTRIDPVVKGLMHICEFPSAEDTIGRRWKELANPNPMVGLAVEIQNAKTKYFLGSLLAASAVGRWGLLIVPDSLEMDRWIQTIPRIIHKGSLSPIPSNIVIVKWPQLEIHIGQAATEYMDISPQVTGYAS